MAGTRVKLFIIGAAGSGKTTLAKRIAKSLGMEMSNLDVGLRELHRRIITRFILRKLGKDSENKIENLRSLGHPFSPSP